MNYFEKAKEARLKVLEMIYRAQSSHIASNFSCIDFLTVLYDKVDLSKDEVIISKGWIAASVYYFLSEKGIVPKEALETYCAEGSPYIGLVEPTVPGVKCAGGSMGYGLPFGVGFALAKKIKKEPGMVYVVMSDGEQAIGTTWEAAAFAAHHELNNLVVIVDKNEFQAMGRTKDVLNMEPLTEKWGAFGWKVQECVNANVPEWFEKDLINPTESFGYDVESNYEPARPGVIIANTTKGKGVSFMEDKLEWHYKNISPEEYEKAREEITNEKRESVFV